MAYEFTRALVGRGHRVVVVHGVLAEPGDSVLEDLARLGIECIAEPRPVPSDGPRSRGELLWRLDVARSTRYWV